MLNKYSLKNILLLIIAFLIINVNAQSKVWTPEISIKIKQISDLNFSNNNKIAMVVREALTDGEKSEYLSQIWLSHTDFSEPIQFTYHEKSSTHPRFSPDGKFLAFISDRVEKPQIWVIRTNGGEAWQFTFEKQGVGSFKWSPNGSKIAFLMKNPKTEKEEKDEKEKRDVILVDKNFKYSHLYLKSFTTNIDTTNGDRITKGEYDITSFSWNPNGKNIVFSQSLEPTFNSRFVSGDISIVNVNSETVRKLVSWGGNDTSPIFTPNGKTIIFTSDGEKNEPIGFRDIYKISSNGGIPYKIAETPNRSASIIACSSNSNYLYVSDANRTKSEIYKIGLNNKEIIPILNLKGRISSSKISNNSEMIVLVKQELNKPSEVYLSELSKISPKKISNFNSSLKFPKLANTKLITWISKDGLEIEGLLTYPTKYNKRKKYPLALIIHGGPAGVFSQSFTGNPGIYNIEYFASNGYAVLRPNPRGSTGYGKDFRFANFKDWGFGDYEDIMSGVDKAIDMGIADPQRLAVMGWSYGGYMTSFVVTRTERFKAASMGAGLPNLISMTTTTDIPDYLVAHMGGEFWEDYETYEKHSAIYRINNVKTPTQVIHGANDLRVPFTQGQEFYVALKRKGVSTEMVVYPRTPHGPREPKLLMDVSPRIMAWLDKFIKR
jgi:dipeptidyl aminopeptidase/acylaminoacyl peptidase